jgi:hypothetical protein
MTAKILPFKRPDTKIVTDKEFLKKCDGPCCKPVEHVELTGPAPDKDFWEWVYKDKLS